MNLYFLLVLIPMASAKITIDEYKIDTDKTYLEIHPDIKKADGKTVVTIEYDFKQDLPETAHFEALISLPFDGKVMPILRIEPLPFCKFLNMEKKPAIIKMAQMMIKSFGELPEECPIKKGKYGIKNLELEDDFIIPFVPNGQVQFELMLYIMDGDKMKQISKTLMKATIDQPED